jgi:hypothetical protein
MASKAVVDAVKTKLGSTFGGVPVLAINSGEETPASGDPFFVLQFPFSESSRVGLSRIYREEGGFRIVINGTRGAGEEQILDWAEDLSDLFRDQKFDGVETQVPSAPFIDDNNEEGNYFVASIVVPYTYNYTG